MAGSEMASAQAMPNKTRTARTNNDVALAVTIATKSVVSPTLEGIRGYGLMTARLLGAPRARNRLHRPMLRVARCDQLAAPKQGLSTWSSADDQSRDRAEPLSHHEPERSVHLG